MHDQSHIFPPPKNPSNDGAWRILKQEILLESPHLKVCKVEATSPLRPGGHPAWFVVQRKPAVVIVPRTKAGNFLMIAQERVAVQSLLLEFPAGQIDSPNADEAAAESAARRELLEETGYTTPERLVPLGRFFSSPGFTNETQTIYLAEAVEPSAEEIDPRPDEAIAGVREISPGELRNLVARGGIRDANSLVAFSLLSARGIL